MSYTYSLYISHSWSFCDAYNKLVALLSSRCAHFSFRNFAVPRNDPVHEGPALDRLYSAIEERMADSNVVLILAGVYDDYRKWIDLEIEIARRLGKPIIAIETWGSDMTAPFVRDAATRIVKWRTDTILNAIRETVTVNAH